MSDLRFLVYLVEIVYPTYNAHCFVMYMILNYCDILKQQQIFTLRGVSSTFLNNIVGQDVIWDVDNTVVVGGNDGHNSLQYAVVRMNNNVLKRKINVVSKSISEKFVVYASHNLLYNLKYATSCSFNKCYDKLLKFADEVELSLVNTANEWSHAVVDTCLKNFFARPKILYCEDIIVIDLKEYGLEIFYTTNKLNSVNQKLFFKCNKIIYKGRTVTGGYLCATNKSTVKQLKNVQDFIPKVSVKYSENVSELLMCPTGLNIYFESLKKAVVPFVETNHKTFLPTFLLEGQKGCGKSLLIQCVASHFGMHLYTISNFEVTANVYAQNESKLRNLFFGAKMTAPTILEIDNFENFGKNNEGEFDERLISHFTNELKSLLIDNTFPIIVFCCSNEKYLPMDLKRVFLKTFEIKAPGDVEREKLLSWILSSLNVKTDIDVNNLANSTHGFLFEDLRALIDRAVTEYSRECDSFDYVPKEYFLQALEFMQSNYNKSLGAPKVPKVKWQDVGGLNDVKEEIIKTIKLPLKHPKLLKSSGLKRSGILLYGPPGTGKTLIAKAVATECGLCFLSVKGPELLNMYVGQSEQNVRAVFQSARDASPCIIFFDELDSLAPNRGASGDSGGVMDRVVSQLLAEMDGLNQTGTVFIIGATNRPDLIDPALLRPGRIDKLLHVGPCIDRDSKIAVLKALTRKFYLEKDSLIEQIVDFCPKNFTGADFYGVCSTAWTSAVRRLITTLEKGIGDVVINQPTYKDVVVTASDFKHALKSAKPSINQEDLEYFAKMRSNS